MSREVIQIVEIVQPFCNNEFGVSPCTATGTADQKCYNTRSTCQDTANFDRGTRSLYFSRGHVAEQGVSGAPYIIPSLVSVSTSPTRVNLAVADRNAQGLGNRAVCTITFRDHPHTDRRVDDYVDGRSWDPLQRGSFWTKWIARNKYRQNVVINVYEGYAGQALGAMVSRQYFLQNISGPTPDGSVTITGKDILARVEQRKAQAPTVSPGVLYTAITDSVTSFEVAGAVLTDYSAGGTLRIGDEIMTYTTRATTTNGVTFSGIARGTDGTTAEAHDVDAGVQECLRYNSVRVDDVLDDLLGTYAGIDAAYLDSAGWVAEADTYLAFYNLTALITEPTAVQKLVSEVQEQALCYLWWDERDKLVKLKAVRGVDEEPDTLTERDNLLAGSFSMTPKPDQRASQVWVYYDQFDYTKDETSPAAYLSQFVLADLTSEGADLYGEASIRKVWARWLPSDALAQNTATKINRRYVDIPNECQFSLDAKDRSYWVGDVVKINHHLDVDEFGANQERQWLIISAEETVPGDTVRYVAADVTLYGRIHYIMANSAVDYPGYDVAPFKNCYIGDANGLLSDGELCGVIS